jgi:transcriptional regulator with XRE-family HTH domain
MSTIMTTPIASFADRLRAALRAAGMTQTHLADLIGTSKQAVSAWAQGKNIPQFDLACRLARALHVPLESLCDPSWHGEEEEQP